MMAPASGGTWSASVPSRPSGRDASGSPPPGSPIAGVETGGVAPGVERPDHRPLGGSALPPDARPSRRLRMISWWTRLAVATRE